MQVLPDALPCGTRTPEPLQNQRFRQEAVGVEVAGSNPVTPIFYCQKTRE